MIGEFCQRAKDVFLISEIEAFKLAKYLFDIEGEDVDNDKIQQVDVLSFKLENLIGKYPQWQTNTIYTIIHEMTWYFKASKYWFY